MLNKAIFVGLSDFGESPEFKNLRSPENNIKIYVSFLKSLNSFCSIDFEDHIYLDINASETRRVIADFFREATSETSAFVCITGHGVVSNQSRDLVIPTNGATEIQAKASDPLVSIALERDVVARFNDSECQNATILLDCCHANYVENRPKNGHTDTTDMRASRATNDIMDVAKGLVSQINTIARKKEGLVFITAAGADQSSYEQPLDETYTGYALYRTEYGKLGISSGDSLSRFARSLLEALRSPTLEDELSDEQRGSLELSSRLLEQKHNFRKAFEHANPDDGGIISVRGAAFAAGAILGSLETPQTASVLDPQQISDQISFAVAPGPSRKVKLSAVRDFAATADGLTDKARDELNTFLSQAFEEERSKRTPTDLLYERDLYDCVKSNEQANFLEIVYTFSSRLEGKLQRWAATRLLGKEHEQQITVLHERIRDKEDEIARLNGELVGEREKFVSRDGEFRDTEQSLQLSIKARNILLIVAFFALLWTIWPRVGSF